jgi:hypothetical protein
MALVDFYQLGLLYKLARCNGGTPSNHTHPPLPTPPNSHPRGITPPAHGTSVIHKLGPEEESPARHTSSTYEEYLTEDFNHHRVFIGMETFMTHVLRIPDDWKEVWGPTIEQIKRSPGFLIAHETYFACCDNRVPEKSFYEPLAQMANAIYAVTESESSDESVKPLTQLRYLRGDTRKIFGGVMPDLSPDIIAVQRELYTQLRQADGKTQRPGSGSKLTWAQPLQVLEVKAWGTVIDDGSSMPRLKENGKCEIPTGVMT